MNGTEQRRQHTVAQKLDQTAENLAVLFDALDARVFDLARKAQETRREVNELRADLSRLLRDGVYDVATDLMVPLATIATTARDVNELKLLMNRMAGVLDEGAQKFDEIDARLAAMQREIRTEQHWRFEFQYTWTVWRRLVWLVTGR